MPRRILEVHTIEQIPSGERHGSVNSLLSLWFISNAQVLVVTFGFAIVALGLSFPMSVLAIVLGVALGTPIMAYHSAQGPKLGVPQMIQSRAQFGLYGGSLPTFVAFLMYIAFVILGSTVRGPSTASLLHVGPNWGIVIFNVAALAIVWIGYDLIHRYNRVLSILTALLFVALLIRLATSFAGHLVTYHTTGNGVVNFMLGVTIAATNQITWAPYVSDYSRYLPEDTSVSRAVWLTGVGAAFGGAFSMIIGALAGFLAMSQVSTDTAGYLAGVFHGGNVLLLLVLLLGALPGQLESIYGAFLTGYTTVSPSGLLGRPVPLRLAVTVGIAALSSAVAILAHGSLVTFIVDLSVIALDLLIPWTAINLTDFYLVRRGRYDVGGFFRSDVYGTVNWRTIGVYLASFGIELLFTHPTFFEGPIASLMGGADVSWLVGFMVASGLYLLVRRVTPSLGDLERLIAEPGAEFPGTKE